MTFEEFQAARYHSTDLEAALNISIYDDPVIKCPGYVYPGWLYIEQSNNNWPLSAQEQGTYFLCIGNWDSLSFELEPLERRLYEYAVSEKRFTR